MMMLIGKKGKEKNTFISLCLLFEEFHMRFICISSKSLSEKYCDLQYLQLATCKIRMELDIMDRLQFLHMQLLTFGIGSDDTSIFRNL